MPTAERCAKYPSIPKAYCSHCQTPEATTSALPKFSIREGRFNGFPVIEVLSNGGPIHEFDEHFQFGVRKAQLLLWCVDVLGRFCQASEEERRDFKGEVIQPPGPDGPALICVEPHKNFQQSTGGVIDHPWLKLEGIYPGEEPRLHIGVGALKCCAICEVQENIRAWLNRSGIAV